MKAARKAPFIKKHYYPFGMLMPGRKYLAASSSKYRFGFNGKENDNDVKGEGNEQDYGMRIYDPRIGKFLSVDPLTKSYAWYSPYQYAGNKPIWAVDLDGLEESFATDKWSPEIKEKIQISYGRIDPIFKNISNESDADFLGMTSDQTVKFVSTFQNENKNIIVKQGDPSKPVITIYKYKSGYTAYGDIPEYRRFQQIEQQIKILFQSNSAGYLKDLSEDFKKIAKALNENPNLKINIYGQTNLSKGEVLKNKENTGNIKKSDGTNYLTTDLVKDRSDAILKTLTEDYKIDPNRITVLPPVFDGPKEAGATTGISIIDDSKKPKELQDLETKINTNSSQDPK